MNEDITITADGVTIHAAEKVSTGDYESGDVSAEIEATVEGVDITDGVPDDLQQRLYGLQRAVQNVTKAAAEERKAE